jgi:hypothetical protein
MSGRVALAPGDEILVVNFARARGADSMIDWHLQGSSCELRSVDESCRSAILSVEGDIGGQ